MIKQISDTAFIFSFSERPPMNNYGDDPYLDSLGVTFHLSPIHKIHDQEAWRWIVENDLPYRIETHDLFHKRIIFTDIENALAFKLRWL